MITGVLLFAAVSNVVLRPTSAESEGLPLATERVLLCVSLGACSLSLLLRRRVPKRSTDESADLFWKTAGQPVMVVWALLDAACLLPVFVYARTSSTQSVVVAAMAVLLFIVLNPWYFERR